MTGGRLRVVESNVIIRGMTLRPGDDPDAQDPDDRDGFSIGKSGSVVENVILDSNSVSWAIDENISTWGSPSNITISNNIIAEALRSSLHSKGDHSMGLLIGDESSNVSVIGNLLVSNEFRNALVKDDSTNIEFINNLIYNYGGEGLVVAGKGDVHAIGNVFIKGQDSGGREAIRFISNTGEASYYVTDNVAEVGGVNTSQIQSDFVFDPATTEVMSSSEVVDWILENAGARFDGEVSEIDQRIIDSVLDNTGAIIDSQKEAGGYGKLEGGTALADSDGDGIPDFYEQVIGSDAKVADANRDADGDGYSNIEDYINGLLDGFSNSGNNGNVTQPDGGDETDLDNGNGNDNTSGAIGTVITVEAEDLDLTDGWATKSLSSASDGKVIQNESGELQSASLAFDGDAGVYSLTVTYFDENDGVSTLAVLVNGEQVATWDWDEELGSALANKSTLTSKVIEGLELKEGDVVTLQGQHDAGEPLRIDTVSLEMTGELDDTDTDTGTDTGNTGDLGDTGDTGDLGDVGDVGAIGTVISVEAEDMVLTDGYVLKNVGGASGGTVIQNETDTVQTASYAFDGDAGVYSLSVNYFDENDGVASLAVLVNGEKVASWDWDANLGSALANNDTKATKLIEGLELSAGDVISLQGLNDGGEPVRVDSIDLEMTNVIDGSGEQAADNGAEWLFIEAESFVFDTSAKRGFEVTDLKAASGGQVLSALGDAEAWTNFDGESGTYDVGIDHFDENDGVSYLEFRVNGEVIDSWHWDADLGDRLANKNTLTRHLVSDVEISAGDEISLVGYGDGGSEPLRIDALEFMPSDTILS
ncbi:right-handed parallel beta-helix repeat-containing protein [Alloyangia pacifica]|uniref:right-handed parallel beta-helix repeat-containing protein n=1 Tax=Alloyangia pacifica TaxID=311180 RepID=UPI000B80E72B|nr:right-handed parallel beta-helix repeat-containing protein [Alloyangia pacifica]